MCRFCTQHGEGKKWYENMANYTAEVFHQVNSEQNLLRFLRGFSKSLRDDVATASRWQRRFPRIYRFIVYPILSRKMEKTHFGQVVPLEDIETILSQVEHIVRLPCVCRKVSLGAEKRYCFGVGMDLTPILAEVPDFAAFEYWTRDQAKAFIRQLDQEGKTHSVWTFNTPFIGAICNCDQDCMAYRAQITLGVTRTMWKAEYVAEIDPLLCTGCNLCRKRCYFDAIAFDRDNNKCLVDVTACYGCGICRPGCQHEAIRLIDRATVPAAAANW
ncbi:MAG: 4Fe-4S binding protein [Proteobacteria bacterium]|nr:4Fe-4S binding protein [Pseudomonadota bacterium]